MRSPGKVPEKPPVKPQRPSLPVRLLPPLSWMALIFWVSHQPHLNSGLEWDFFLRKTAHLGEYALLAWLWLGALSPGGSPDRGATLGALGISIVYAAVDEWHQSFVPGRFGNPWDVALDSLGAVAGVWWGIRRKAEGFKS